MNDVGYYYFFQGRFKHIGLYKSWVNEARSAGIQMQMVTSLPRGKYSEHREEIERYTDYEYITVLCAPFGFRGAWLAILVYFFIAALRHDRIVVHVRKRSTKPLDLLKSVLGDERIKYIVEFEGDPKAECDYLEANPYREGFYDCHIANQRAQLEALPERLQAADGLLMVTEILRDRFDERYPEANVAEKASVIPSGVNAGTFSYAAERRMATRRRLGFDSEFVLIYVGGVHYSWQNCKRLLEIYALLQESLDEDIELVFLVREKDHPIVREFADSVDVNDDEYDLREVPHEAVGDYLNAADMGVLLRDDHPMNRAVTTAKLGEYLVAGLPVLTTRVTFRSDKISEKGYGIVLQDLDDDREIVQKFQAFLTSTVDRQAISQWAKAIFSTETYRERYVELLEKLGSEEPR